MVIRECVENESKIVVNDIKAKILVKSNFMKIVKENESNEIDNIYNVAHSFEFRMRDNTASVYDQLNPNSIIIMIYHGIHRRCNLFELCFSYI